MFGIGGTELVIILLFAFLIVGPDRLPDVAKTLGNAVAKFRNAQDQMNDVIRTETAAIKSEVEASRTVKRTVKATPKAEEKVEEPENSKPFEDDGNEGIIGSGDSAESTEPAEPAEQPARTLSFSERKALYEKEKAAKLEAEKAAAAAEKEGE